MRDLLRLELVGDFLFDRLTREGPLTAKGRTRAALSAYLATVDRLHRLRQLVGLDRRQRPVDPLDALRAAVERANREHAEPEPTSVESEAVGAQARSAVGAESEREHAEPEVPS